MSDLKDILATVASVIQGSAIGPASFIVTTFDLQPVHDGNALRPRGGSVGPQIEIFSNISAYKRPAGAYPLGYFFLPNFLFVGSFMIGHVFKFGSIRSRGFRVIGV